MKKLESILNEEYEDEMNGKERKHLEGLHDHLTQHYNKEKYNSFEHRGLKKYTEGTSVNHSLWNAHKTNGFVNRPEHKQLINQLDSAMKAVRAPRKFRVYSNTRMDPREHMYSEGIVHHPAYMSTSINNKFPRHWGEVQNDGDYETTIYKRHILKFDIPKGHEGSYVGDHISTCPDQHEFILPRGTNLKHIKTEVIREPGEKYYPRSIREHHIHHMKIVP